MKCPVCPSTSGASALSCENCGVDLRVMRRVEEMPGRFYNEALALLHEGEAERAIHKLHAVLAFDDGAADARRLLGKALWNAGRTREARAQWRLLEDDEQARELLELEAGEGTTARPGSRPAALLLVAAVSAVVGGLVTWLWCERPRPPPAQRVVATWLPGEHAPRLAAVVPAPPIERAPGIAKLEARLRGRSDWVATREGDRLRVSFGGALFKPDTDVPTSPAKGLLRALGRHLARLGALQVVVEGRAAPGKWSLALDRARSAIELMRHDAGETVVWLARPSTLEPMGEGDDEESVHTRAVVLHIAEP